MPKPKFLKNFLKERRKNLFPHLLIHHWKTRKFAKQMNPLLNKSIIKHDDPKTTPRPN